MLSTFHLAVGGALGVSRLSYANVLALAFCSHFLMDALPHWDLIIPPYTDTMAFAWLDMALGWVFLLCFIWGRPYFWKSFLCAGFAILPDVINFLYLNHGVRSLYMDALSLFHIDIQIVVGPFWGFIWQFFLLFSAAFFLLRARLG